MGIPHSGVEVIRGDLSVAAWSAGIAETIHSAAQFDQWLRSHSTTYRQHVDKDPSLGAFFNKPAVDTAQLALNAIRKMDIPKKMRHVPTLDNFSEKQVARASLFKPLVDDLANRCRRKRWYYAGMPADFMRLALALEECGGEESAAILTQMLNRREPSKIRLNNNNVQTSKDWWRKWIHSPRKGIFALRSKPLPLKKPRRNRKETLKK